MFSTKICFSLDKQYYRRCRYETKLQMLLVLWLFEMCSMVRNMIQYDSKFAINNQWLLCDTMLRVADA